MNSVGSGPVPYFLPSPSWTVHGSLWDVLRISSDSQSKAGRRPKSHIRWTCFSQFESVQSYFEWFYIWMLLYQWVKSWVNGWIESKCRKFITTKSSDNYGTKYKSRKCKIFDLEPNIAVCYKSELYGKVCPRCRNEHKESFNRDGFTQGSLDMDCFLRPVIVYYEK